MYSVREVMQALDIRRLSFHNVSFGESASREIFTRGIYGGVRNLDEVVLAFPRGNNVIYMCSRKSQTNCFSFGFLVNSSGFLRVMQYDGAKKLMHPDYEEQLRKNSECPNMVLMQSRDFVDTKNGNVVMYGVEVGEERFQVFKSSDFPSQAVETGASQINIIREFCVDKDNFPVSKEAKEDLLNQLMGLALRRKQYLWGQADLRRCRAFMYDNKPYIATKITGEQVYMIYALVQRDTNNMDLIRVNHYKIDELTEAAKREFKTKQC